MNTVITEWDLTQAKQAARDEILELLRIECQTAHREWEKLALPLLNDNYDEDYSNTVNRLTAHGYLSAIEDIIETLSNKENN